MPSIHLASDATLTVDVFTTVLQLDLDPGVWILLASLQVEDSWTATGDPPPAFTGRFFDGESTFFGSGTVAGFVNWTAASSTRSAQLVFMGVADLSAATVATTVYCQVCFSQNAYTATAKVRNTTDGLGTYAPSWFIATEFGGPSTVSFPPPPTAYTSGTVHSGLTGSGSISLTAPVNGVQVEATTIPTSWGFADWTPTHYIPAWCELAWGAPGDVARTELLHEVNNIHFQPFGVATTVYYSIKPGWVARITEVTGT